MPRRYPLDALLQLRQQESEAQAAQVAQKTRQREAAGDRVERAAEARQRELNQQRQLQQQELERLQQGGGRVSDLAAAATWAVGAEQRLETRGAEEQQAREELAERVSDEARSRAELGKVEAKREAVDRHRERWRREQDARAEQQVEEDVADLWQARRGRQA